MKYSKPARQWKIRFGRLLCMILLPLLFFVVLEVILRMAGAGFPTRFFVAATKGEAYVTNLKFGWRFFPPRVARWPSPQVLPRIKAPDDLRIFVLGGSAAYGTPSDCYGFVRILQVMLDDRFPDLNVQVVNAALTAASSHVVLPIAQDCAELEPDLFVLYMGNNEVIGPYGAGSVFGRKFSAPWAIRAHIRLQSFALTRVLRELMDWNGTDWGNAESWQGMAAFTEHRISADDPRLENVSRFFRQNVNDIIDAASASGAHLVACTVKVNVGDCPPFASENHPKFKDTAIFDTVFARARSEFGSGGWAQAAAGFARCVELDGEHADSHYWLKKSLEAGGGDETLARHHAELAKEKDVLRFRASANLNSILRERCKNAPKGEVTLLDIDRDLSDGSGGLSDSELFYEHVHFTFLGNFEVASRLLKAIDPVVRKRFALPLDSQETVPDLEACATRLGYTVVEHERYDRFILEEMMGKAPFTGQQGHEERHARLLREHENKYAGILTSKTEAEALAACREQMDIHPDDLYVRRTYLNHCSKLDQSEEAIQVLEHLVERQPKNYFFLSMLAGEHMSLGRDESAKQLFKDALAINPYYYVARHNLAVLRAREQPGDSKHASISPSL